MLRCVRPRCSQSAIARLSPAAGSELSRRRRGEVPAGCAGSTSRRVVRSPWYFFVYGVANFMTWLDNAAIAFGFHDSLRGGGVRRAASNPLGQAASSCCRPSRRIADRRTSTRGRSPLPGSRSEWEPTTVEPDSGRSAWCRVLDPETSALARPIADGFVRQICRTASPAAAFCTRGSRSPYGGSGSGRHPAGRRFTFPIKTIGSGSPRMASTSSRSWRAAGPCTTPNAGSGLPKSSSTPKTKPAGSCCCD